MVDQVITESFNVSPLIGILVCGVVALGGCIIFLFKQVDKKDKLNREDTYKRVDELRDDIKELKLENKEDKKMFMDAITSFNKSTDEFRQVGRDMAEIKTDIKSIDKELTNIKSKIDK